MANLGEIEAALDVLVQAGTTRDQVVILHCTTQYTAPFEAVNLRVLPAFRVRLGVEVGYSDHTTGTNVAIAANALGAAAIAQHFTQDRRYTAPEQPANLEPTN